MQELSERESQVQQANLRLENGEIPDEEIHAEWERIMLVEQRREEAKMEKYRVPLLLYILFLHWFVCSLIICNISLLLSA